jgi:hypothetical protein
MASCSLLNQLTELGLLSGVQTEDKPDETTTISILTKLYQVTTASKEIDKVASPFSCLFCQLIAPGLVHDHKHTRSSKATHHGQCQRPQQRQDF